MALRQIHLGRQAQDGTLTVEKVAYDFLKGMDWNLTNGDNNATITGVRDPLGANDVATKGYVDGLVAPVLKTPDSWDASSGNFPTQYKGVAVKEGDTFLITVAGTLGTGTKVNVGDLLVAKTNTPGQTDANWFVLESNRDQATETVKGVARIATSAEITTGTDDTTIVTPLKLKNALNSISQPSWAKELITLTDTHISSGITLGHTPKANSVMLFLNGLLQYEGVGQQYTVSGATITLVNGSDWNVGDIVLIQYQYE